MRTATHTHMVIKTNSRFGNFAWSASADVSDEMMKTLAAFGLLQVLQRGPSSKAEKALAGYEKRPDGFKRDSIPFSDKAAKALAIALRDAEIEDGLSVQSNVEVVEYIAPEGVQSKFTEEKAIIAKHETAGDVVKWARETVKFDGELFASEEIGQVSVPTDDFLRAVRTFKIAALKGL